MSKRITLLILEDIYACIETIETYTSNISFDQFINNRQTYEATLFNFHIIGEAASQIPKEFKEANPQVDWNDVKSFRNKLIHEYFGVNSQIVWDVIKFDLPELKTQIGNLINQPNE